ncbi:MAG TPA: SPFH domain-containing protein [Euryarchaeota archaeon]|nr:MAG: hypothetical protein DRN55_02420 [Thermoplasmata archaeon]HDD59780.1 SPFH domain-containing protein [Euryarchaeota archaeon]
MQKKAPEGGKSGRCERRGRELSSALLTLTLWILIIVVLILIPILLKRSVLIVWPYQVVICEKRGGFVRVLDTPGLHFVTPLFRSLHPVDIRTQTLNFPPMNLYSKDMRPFTLEATAFVKVEDPVKAHYHHEYYLQATKRAVQKAIKDVAAEMELEDIYLNREILAVRSVEESKKVCAEWGVSVEAMDVKDVVPRDPKEKIKLEEMYNKRRRALEELMVVKVIYE